ncbi:alpha-amylase [Nocardioides gansuensis]|uniref:Alpha-amylase n=1 Tax=Nocardioides gansuensis TaxID=2138300 RepID=A0A2T8FE01_9ACTN|nr:sugar phosphorylase [Nocardioides gansuensis]PVG83919.1 alpha-amylase [Nocardioides gansuensis]
MNRDALATAVLPHLRLLYGERAGEVTARLVDLAEAHAGRIRGERHPPNHATAYLITYGDAIRRPGETPLHTLAQVLRDRVADVVTDVHLLPMFPWTSDDGFAVVDHRQVNPELGTWTDVAELATDHGLLFDFVANHVSASSDWFRRWLAGDPAYQGFFVERDPKFDTSRVVRPRVLPLFHDYQRPDGSTATVWTTFGPDQVDVNLAEPQVLLELTDVLLGYLGRGASGVRLDAIGFLWKESGTTCIHLPQAHAVVKVWRAVVDQVAPGTALLTETNVPHAENVSYFGDGSDEAHLVYQFALPPLVLHSFVAGSTAKLTRWAQGIGPVSGTATWFNFLASHDGIGLRATEGILEDAERQALVDRTLAHGGRVSMAAAAPGQESVYELNIGYIDALATPDEERYDEVVVAKALAAHSILLSVVGVPALYYHSLFGSRPDHEGMHLTGISRRINREVLDADVLQEELSTDPRRRGIFEGLATMLGARRRLPALSPYVDQDVEALDERVFAVRRAAGTPEEVLSVTNVTGEPVVLEALSGRDQVTGEERRPLRLGPWGYAWLTPS